MKITKSINNRFEIIKKLDDIYQCILEESRKFYLEAEISHFNLNIYCKDEDIELENFEEFKNYQAFIRTNQIDGFYLSIQVKEKKEDFNTVLIIRSHSQDDGYTTLSAQSEDVNLAKTILKALFIEPLSKCKIYKYNPGLEKKEQEANITKECIDILDNIKSFQIKIKEPINDEKELQRFLFPILKSHFNDLEDEFHLPRFGTIEYKPDFGIPKARLLIETKYIKTKNDIKKTQKEINDDTIGYLSASKSSYRYLVVLIYNSRNFPIPEKFSKDLEKNKNIKKVILAPGVTPSIEFK